MNFYLYISVYYRGNINRRLNYGPGSSKRSLVRRLRLRHLLALGVVAGITTLTLGFATYRSEAVAKVEPVEEPAPLEMELALPDRTEPLSESGASSPTPNIRIAKIDIPPSEERDEMEISTATEGETQETDSTLSEEALSGSEPPEPDWKTLKVRSGDSMARIFKRNGADAGDLHRIISLGKPSEQLKRLKPGQTLHLALDDNGDVLGLRYEIDRTRTLVVNRDDDRFEAETQSLAVEKRSTFANATIDDSLYLSAKRAGLSDNLIMELANIFGWDVDFALDVRKGDSFSVLWQEHYADGEKVKDGAILAAEFINKGRTVRAVRYTDPKGRSNYFTPDGYSMRKEFLRSPVDFRRISSRFAKSRWHPVLGKKRPHRGVDYAAAIGTPIKASGDGKVIHVGKKGGYGRTIIIQHGSRYTTLYAHLNGYKRGIKKGKYVKQGQTIGFVGKSGLATGPHLHYEFRVNGVHRNPLTVKLPKASPVPKKHKQDFLSQTRPLMAELEQHLNTRLALADTE